MSAGISDSSLNVNNDLRLLAPEFALAVSRALEECNSQENRLDARVYEGYRSNALQAIYYKRGRTVIPPYKTVTSAPTNLHSWHGFGLAVDVIHRTKNWNPPGGEAWFRKVASIFKKYNCTWGGDWKRVDLPHFQWHTCPASPSDIARQLITDRGFEAVWNHFGAIDGTPIPAELPAVLRTPIEDSAKTSTRELGIISGEGFSCTVFEDGDGRVYFEADADIDADGANGQFGWQPAYMNDDSGSDALANGGMRVENGKVIFFNPLARDIIIVGEDNQPKIFDGGLIASMTWYRHPGMAADDPNAYVDSESVPYIVVPPLVVQRTVGVVRGCRARVTWNGRSIDCVVADKGSSKKIGELSIAAARALGMDPSPRSGGVENPEVLYELWPGLAAPGFVLQRA